jgi:diacylglycerol kinase family enzyme
MTGTSRSSYLRLFLDVIGGRTGENSDITILADREIIVKGDRAIQVDGDYFGRAPVRIRAVAGFVRLIV